MTNNHNVPTPSTASKVLAACRPGLAILLEAVESAKELEHEVWDFAVEFPILRNAGLTSNNLRWLLCMGYLEQAIETTRPQATQRTFQRAGNLMLSERSCFVLTPAGMDLARGRVPVPHKHGRPSPPPVSADPRPATLPRWDSERRELRWGPKLVKRFRIPALNQELILAAFEEEGWPHHLDDPLPTSSNYDAKQRLQDTIKRLNRHQVNRLIHFRGDGSGTGVTWEPWD
jgi:hypothetical protein